MKNNEVEAVKKKEKKKRFFEIYIKRSGVTLLHIDP